MLLVNLPVTYEPCLTVYFSCKKGLPTFQESIDKGIGLIVCLLHFTVFEQYIDRYVSTTDPLSRVVSTMPLVGGTFCRFEGVSGAFGGDFMRSRLELYVPNQRAQGIRSRRVRK